MAVDGDVDAAREHVQTYVPAYQKDEWVEHADRLDMSLSEFVRTMVQAGRSDLSPEPRGESSAADSEPAGDPSSDSEPRGRGLEDRVEAILSDGEFYDWDELVAALTDDVEDRLEEALQELQSQDRVRYSGRNGGYALE